MFEISPDEIGKQLRKPEGEFGKKIATGMNISNIEMYDGIFSQLNIKDNENILEIGFGNGKFFNRYLEINPNIYLTGIDFSELMCEETINNNQEIINNGKLKIINTNSLEIPFSDNYFDKIITLNTLYFWENPSKQLNELKRVLNKNGLFIMAYRPKACIEKLPFSKDCFNLYDPQQVNLLLENNGLKIVNERHCTYDKKSIDGTEVTMTDIFITSTHI